MLKLFNIEDSQVRLFKENKCVSVVLMLISLLRLILSLIFVLPGDLMVFPLSAAISYYTEQERIKALKGSKVKIRANDVRSSVKIVAYISTYPIYLCLFTLLFNRVLIYQYSFDSIPAAFYSWIFFWVFPIISVVAIRSHDGVRTHYTEFQGRLLSLFYVGQVELIKETRKTLKQQVRDIVDKVGP
jgi:uncharacterized membrane protein